MKTRIALIILLFLAAVGIAFLLLLPKQETPSPAKGAKPPAPQAQPEKPAGHTVRLTAVGDVLIHDRVYNDAKTGTSYDFKPMLASMKPYIEPADAAFVNQESVVGGAELGLSTYPSFNSPVEIADALKDTGFDVIGTANNHALDRGEKALRNSIAYWNKLGLLHTGTFESEADRENIRTFTKNGITFSVLAYTFGTNGIRSPQPYLVNYIDRERMKRDVAKAKQLSDAVVVMLHFGTEFETMPNTEQQSLAQYLTDLGVTIIFGHHPHVLQPPAFLTGKNGQQTFVAYSLGNFLAGQENQTTWFGGVMNIQVNKDAAGHVTVANPSFLPTLNYSKQAHGYRVLPLENVTKEQYPDAPAQYAAVVKHMRTFIPDLQIVQAK
ncbi:CapA family protein [Ectobacillus ponti]|uniref:CapA family protein n=1 Tax=Ectobacillus ponti TaxID=2961894 RepID=A0AA42BMU1_9BACI|nr:CapA family protein [Ectobacillus ponti]MCP8966987.1 CapA family protein [Ectobacillus ponti]